MNMAKSKVINIISLVKECFSDNLMVPQIAQALKERDDEEFLSFILSNSYMVWGSDTVGGIAYFGKTEDILKIQKQAENYLYNMSKSHAENQFYIFWQLDEYSLLMLYEDYQEEIKNPYPVFKGVLSVHFGAWMDDDQLLSVLEEKLYCNDSLYWKYGNEDFNSIDSNQLKLLEEMKKLLPYIDNSLKSHE